MPRLIPIEPDTATGEAKELLDGVRKKLGITPNVIRTMASSPAVLKAYLGLDEALSTGRFDAKSREAIALTVAGVNACEYCAAAHTAISKSLKVGDDEIGRRLDGHSGDPELDPVLRFARKLVEKRGFVDDEDISEVRAAGHDDGAIAEIVANVAANILTNYLNHVAQTEVDFPRVELAAPKAA